MFINIVFSLAVIEATVTLFHAYTVLSILTPVHTFLLLFRYI